MSIFEIQSNVMLAVVLALLVLKGFAFVASLLYSGEAYEAAGKLTKPAWVAITGLGFAAAILQGGLGLLALVFTVAALVFVLDVRPALREVSHRR